VVDAGRIPFLEVLQARRDLLVSEDALVQSEQPNFPTPSWFVRRIFSQGVGRWALPAGPAAASAVCSIR
jgi:hypothetical protein